MKKAYSLILALLIIFNFSAFTNAAPPQKISVKINGQDIGFKDAEPFIDENGRTLVPIRFIAENKDFGCDVKWDADSQKATISKNNLTITLKIGESKADINGKTKTFDTKAILKQNRTFVPLRFVGEALGATFGWNSSTRTVTIDTAAPVPDLGKIQGSTYKNDYFGMTFEIPENWQVQDRETIEQIQQNGNDIISGDNKDLKDSLAQSSKITYNLFMVSKYAPGSAELSNVAFQCVAEKLSSGANIKTGKDYLESARKLMESSKLKYTFNNDIKKITIDNVEFYEMDASVKIGYVTANMNFYATISKGYALSFSSSYFTQEGLKTTEDLLKAIKFNN